ncbi:hypothetical protein Tco_0874088 [Tanacetum coccineum]|uniref:Uncharacterized protein n=1 Tax=Tanacetum coccineum TaxID=301880 RepID=A0ABQ5BNG9_9ASTR
MQQFWDTASKNAKNDKYYFILDCQRFEIGAELFSKALRLDSTPHNVGEEARLEKLKYVAKGEPRGKRTFGMPIPESMMSREIKESNAYKQKDEVPRHSRTITYADNLLEDQGQALDYAILVNQEENQQREMELRSKQRHARIVLEKQVNKEVDKGYKHMKIKIKAQEKLSPKSQLLLNLKKQRKENKEQRILDDIRKAPREGSSAALESPNHSDSSDNSDDDMIKSDRDSNHGAEHDKSDYESADSDKDDSNKDSDKDQAADFVIRPHAKEPESKQPEPQLHSPSVIITSLNDVNWYLVDHTDVQISELLNEPSYTQTTTVTVTPVLDMIHETQDETPPATPSTKAKKMSA